MVTFQARPEDFDGIIRERQFAAVRHALPFPLAALVVAVASAQWVPFVAAFALGAAAAWAYSIVTEVRAIRPALLWQYAWLQENITVTAEEDGLRLASARGTSFMRWDGGISVHVRPDFFLIKEESDELAVLPKKYLTETELLALNMRASSQR